MRDVVFPFVLIGFFALVTLLVRGCEHLLAASGETERQPGGEGP